MQSIYFASCRCNNKRDTQGLELLVITVTLEQVNLPWCSLLLCLGSGRTRHPSLSKKLPRKDTKDSTPFTTWKGENKKQRKCHGCVIIHAHMTRKARTLWPQVRLQPGSSCQHNPGNFRTAESAQNLQVWPEKKPWGWVSHVPSSEAGKSQSLYWVFPGPSQGFDRITELDGQSWKVPLRATGPSSLVYKKKETYQKGWACT